MLVLTRKKEETIRIGQDIEITIIRVRGNSVRLGIKAPQEVRVARGELKPNQANAVPKSKADLPAPKPHTVESKMAHSAMRPKTSLSTLHTSSRGINRIATPPATQSSNQVELATIKDAGTENVDGTMTSNALHQMESKMSHKEKRTVQSRLDSYVQDDCTIPSKIIIGRTKNKTTKINTVCGPLSGYLQNL